ncbi:MAG: hypothetical protein EBS34_12725, partial [Flavobacteriales bacterium]|nr:hypothetical protein [Flavobacteriales bacterium]
MKKLFFFFSFLLSLPFVQGQGMMNDHIKWKYSVEKIDASHANLVMSAKITAGYHVFSLKHNPAEADGTGIVPAFTFRKGSNYKKVGKPFETGTPIKHLDDLGTSYYFENKVTYKQQIEVLSEEDSKVTVQIYFQMCNEKGCLPPFETEGTFNLNGFIPDKKTTVTVADTSEVETTSKDKAFEAKTHMESSSTNASNKGGEKISIEQAEQEMKRQYLSRGRYAVQIQTTVTPLE